MANSVDDRIVTMEFDNKSFEQKIDQTIDSIGHLKKSMEFENAGKGIGDLSKSFGSLNLSGIAAGVENISSKFSALGAIGFSVIQNLTSAAISFAENTAAKVLDPILSGGKSRATNIEQAKFQFQGLGIDVDKAMSSALSAVKGTAFGLDEAAKAAAQFGASGIDAGDDMTTSLRAIAGAAALTGRSYSEMADIFTGSAGSGVVNNQDLGQFATRGLNAAAAVAKQLGITEAQVHQMAADGELDFKTFTKAMDDAFGSHAQDANKTYTGALGNLHAAMSRLGATFFTVRLDQQRDLFNALGPAIDKVTVALKPLIDAWLAVLQVNNTALIDRINGLDFTNVTKAMEDFGHGLVNIFAAIGKVLIPIKEAFRSIFPKSETSTIITIAKAFKDFTDKLIIGADAADTVRQVFSGIFAAIEIGWTVLKEAGRAIGELFSAFSSQNGSKIADFFVDLAAKVAYLNGALVAGGGIRDFFDGLVEAIKDPGKFIDELKTKLIGFFDDVKSKMTDFFTGIDFGSLDGLGDAFGRIKDALAGLIDKWDPSILDGIRDFFSGLFGNFDLQTSNSMEGGLGRLGDRFSELGTVLKAAGKVFVWFGDKLGKFFDALGRLKDWVMEKIHGVIDIITGIGPALLDAAKKLDFDQVMEVIQTGIAAVFAGGFANLSKNGLGLNIDFTGGSLQSISDFFTGLKGLGGDLSKTLAGVTDTLEAMQTKLKAEALEKIAIAMGILSASMILLSTVDPVALGSALTAMGVGFGELAGTMATLSKVVSGPRDAANLGLVSAGLILLATAVLVMSAAVKVFSTMDTEELAKGLGSVTLLIGVMVGAAKLLQDNTAGMITAGIGMTAMAVAMNLLAGAVAIFATMSWESLAKGLGSVAVALGIIVGMMHLLPDGASMVATGVGLVAIGVALNLMAAAVAIFATMSWKDIAKGMVGIAGGLLAIALGLSAMPSGPTMLASAASLLAISFSLNLMATAMKIFASMSWGELAKSLVAMAGALIILAVAADAMEEGLPGAIAIGIMALSLGLLVKALKGFASMKWSELMHGLVGLAAVLTVLGVAGYLIEGAVVGLLGLGAALLLIGAGFALFGIGASAVATAFGLIATAGKAGVDAVMYALDQLIVRLPEIITSFATGILELVQVVLDATPAIVVAIGKIIGSILQEIIDLAPKMGETLVTVIQTGLEAIRKVIPDVVATGLAVLIALLTGVRDNIGQITILVSDIITNFLDALTLKVPEIIDSVYNLVQAILKGVIEKLWDINTALVPKGLELLQGLWDGVKTKGLSLLGWFLDLPGSILGALGDLASYLTQTGKDLIQGMRDGVEEIFDDLWDYAHGIPSAIVSAVGDLITLLEQAGKDAVQGLLNGLIAMEQKIKDWASKIGGWIKSPFEKVMGILSPSTVMQQYGVYIGEGLILGIASMRGSIEGASSNLAYQVVDSFNPDTKTLTTKTLDAVNRALLATAAQLPASSEFQPTITPVLDLSQVQKGSLSIVDMLGVNPSLSVSAFDQARSIAYNRQQQAEDTQGTSITRDTPSTIQFVQNNNSPEALSTAAIYRATRNQLEMAKEELGVS